MPAETLQAVPAEPRSASLPVHQADTGVELVEVDSIESPVDAVLAPIKQVSPEHGAVDAGRVDGIGLPVVPADPRLAAFDVLAHLPEQMPTDVGAVHLGGKGDERDGEQNAATTVMRSGDCLR